MGGKLVQALAIRDFFADGFGATNSPATEAEILEVEHRLGRRLPAILRDLYKLSNGLSTYILEPCLVQLQGEEHSVEYYTSILRKFGPRGEADHCVAFGFTEGWRWWGMRQFEDGRIRVVTFDPAVDTDFRDLGPDLLEAYMRLAAWKAGV